MASTTRSRTKLLMIALFSILRRCFGFVIHGECQYSRHLLFLSSSSNEEDGQKRLRSEDPVLALPLMEAELAAVLSGACVDADRLQQLEREIEHAKTAAEFGVRQAQFQFYEAFSMQDYEKMKSVWSTESPNIACIHPGSTRVEGLEAVLNSWESIFQSNAFTITPVNTKVQICGATAIVSCQEEIEGGTSKVEALNIYQREGRSWRMSLHMASPIAIIVREA